MLLVAVAVVAVAEFCVYRLHAIFGSHNTTSTAGGFSNETAPFNPKHVVLEVLGPPGTVASINYLDVNAQPQLANIVAQGDTDSIGCPIIIDGAVKDERSVNTVNAYTFCADKSG
jgi:Mycobacterium membrane protein